ncbi:uncharacterized protein LOC106640962 [Copidosoma floridanum]|uniref:uncharacterized protein LOC106640962 n=1 Tax=Copidosoma floridanum TaxID=29053 RepID=UPI0006C9C926|nr:uncharacterized protein LOC106640962 [Copidosoma floridanum]
MRKTPSYVWLLVFCYGLGPALAVPVARKTEKKLVESAHLPDTALLEGLDATDHARAKKQASTTVCMHIHHHNNNSNTECANYNGVNLPVQPNKNQVPSHPKPQGYSGYSEQPIFPNLISHGLVNPWMPMGYSGIPMYPNPCPMHFEGQCNCPTNQTKSGDVELTPKMSKDSAQMKDADMDSQETQKLDDASAEVHESSSSRQSRHYVQEEEEDPVDAAPETKSEHLQEAEKVTKMIKRMVDRDERILRSQRMVGSSVQSK